MISRLLLGLVLGCFAFTASAQEEARSEPPEGSGASRQKAGQASMPVAQPGTSSDMVEMARSMSAMADTCRMMVEREMRMMPLMGAAVAIFGVLLALALLLLVVLEIQWIRYWSRRLKRGDGT